MSDDPGVGVSQRSNKGRSAARRVGFTWPRMAIILSVIGAM